MSSPDAASRRACASTSEVASAVGGRMTSSVMEKALPLLRSTRLQDSSMDMRWPEPHSGRSTSAGAAIVEPSADLALTNAETTAVANEFPGAISYS